MGAEDPPLSVGELAIGYASRGAEMDHDLLRRDLFYGSTRASWDRQTDTPHPSKAERKREKQKLILMLNLSNGQTGNGPA